MNPVKTRTKIINFEPVVTDFGNRRVSFQNFSRIVTLNKTALKNCGIADYVNVKLVQDSEEKYIKLTPVTMLEGVKK